MAIARSHESLPLRPKAVSTTVTGAWAELVAAEVLLSLGFEVFQNISRKGPHDLVVMRPPSHVAVGIDVTLGAWNKAGDRLSSSAGEKLIDPRVDTVLVVTVDRELYHATLDKSKGVVYEGRRQYPIVYTLISCDWLSGRI